MNKLFDYLKGLGLTAVALFIYASLDWIHVNAEITGAKFLVPLLMALIIWTLVYLLAYLIWAILMAFASCSFGLIFFPGMIVVGLVALRLAAYTLPAGWITFSSDVIVLFLMGVSFMLIHLVVDTSKREAIVKAARAAV